MALSQFLGERIGGYVPEPRHTVRGSPERGSIPLENDKSAAVGEGTHCSTHLWVTRESRLLGPRIGLGLVDQDGLPTTRDNE